MDQAFLNTIKDESVQFLSQPNAYRSILILAVALFVSYFLSRILTKGIIKLVQALSTRSEKISSRAKRIRYRQIETYLSITIALTRAAIVAVTAYIVWRLLSPSASSSAAAIGASAFFIVVAGQTIGPLLRDITNGAAMITEGWFHVGDFIKVEPFIDMSGVVERFTLRSTKLRNLSGDVIWVHNSQIQAVHVSPETSRKYIVDVFTHDQETAKKKIEEIIATIPTNIVLIKNPIKILSIETWNDQLSHITIQAKTAPGREWVIEQFFIDAIKDVDEGVPKAKRILAHTPTARFADPVAEDKFRKSIR